MDTIFQLCRKYTVLSDPEIEQICRISAFLQLIADLTDADIFIDCPCRARDAIVVAEAKPVRRPPPPIRVLWSACLQRRKTSLRSHALCGWASRQSR